jgi:hypothetical protein
MQPAQMLPVVQRSDHNGLVRSHHEKQAVPPSARKIRAANIFHDELIGGRVRLDPLGGFARRFHKGIAEAGTPPFIPPRRFFNLIERLAGELNGQRGAGV